MCLVPIYPMCGDTVGQCGVKNDHYALLILSLENTSAPYLCEVYILMLYQHMYSFLWLTTSYSCNGRFFFTPIWSRSFFTPLYDTFIAHKFFIKFYDWQHRRAVMDFFFTSIWSRSFFTPLNDSIFSHMLQNFITYYVVLSLSR